MLLPQTIAEYKEFVTNLYKKSDQEIVEITRYMLRVDLFFLIWYGFGRKDVEHAWILARCRDVQENPNGFLDLWAREHYKSTIVTYALTIQDILSSHGNDPLPKWKGVEPTFGIFSHTRPIAKGFLRQIKRELEGNGLLISLFPDVLWSNATKESPKWSEDDGLVVRRKGNPKESTVEAWGLVDSQPTSKHFRVLVYDDVVTEKSITTPDMMQKTLSSWELSTNLGTEGGYERYIGTRYHFNDAYRTLMERGIILRLHPAQENGDIKGKPVFRSKEFLEGRRIKQGPYTYSCQMLLNPIADESQSLKKEWLKWHGGSDGMSMNRYILVDPAGEKKKTSDYTAMFVIGLGEDDNYYVLDMVRDRFNLLDRGDALFRLHRKWKPQFSVGYEQYGMQADVQYIKERMSRENYHFNIIPLGGTVSKNDRIKGLIPSLSQGRWYFPDSVFKTQYDGKTVDLVDLFVNEEYLAFPVAIHDDMLDCMARILDSDLNAIWPRANYDDEPNDRYARNRRSARRGSSWAS